MPILLSINNELNSTTTPHPGGQYESVEIGKPLGIELLTFFPGTNFKEWGFSSSRYGEIMVSSQIRSGPSNEPAPELINIMVRKYSLNPPEPIQNLGGDRYGDKMLFYTKAFTGGRIGITFKGTELDKIPKNIWDGLTTSIKDVGNIALFTPVAPYLSGLGVAARALRIITRAFMRNDRLHLSRIDMEYQSPDSFILQSGRYLIWSNQGPAWQTIKNKYRLTGRGDVVPNVLVSKETGELFNSSPYLIFSIDAEEKDSYANFEIGARSAKLLEEWGDRKGSKAFFDTVQGLAANINDAKQLAHMKEEIKNFNQAATEGDKEEARKRISAYSKLLTEENEELISALLKSYMPKA